MATRADPSVPGIDAAVRAAWSRLAEGSAMAGEETGAAHGSTLPRDTLQRRGAARPPSQAPQPGTPARRGAGRRLAGAVLAAALAAALFAVAGEARAQTQTVVENFGQGGNQVLELNRVAQTFETGPNTGGYTVTHVTLRANAAPHPAGTASTLRAMLCNVDSSGKPPDNLGFCTWTETLTFFDPGDLDFELERARSACCRTGSTPSSPSARRARSRRCRRPPPAARTLPRRPAGTSARAGCPGNGR